MTNFVPINECMAIDLMGIKDEKSVVALHETGHLIVMYALDLMKYFNGIDIKNRDGILGLTDMAPGFADEMRDYATNIAELAVEYNQSGEKLNAFINAQYLQGTKLYLPHICRLFAGGSITRHYGISKDDLCRIDRENIITILRQYQLENQIDLIQNIIDLFLNNIFDFYDTLIKAICVNLLESETLSVADVDYIINEWKKSYPFLN